MSESSFVEPDSRAPRLTAAEISQARIDRENARARVVARGDVGLIKLGAWGVIGIGFAGDLVAHTVLSADQLEALSVRAAAIAEQLRGSSERRAA